MASASKAASPPGGALGPLSRIFGASHARTREALWGYFFLLP